MSSAGPKGHRVVSRRAAALGLAITAGCLVLMAWGGLVWSETYLERMAALVASDPEQARLRVARDLRLFAVFQGLTLWGAAALLVRYGYRGLRTASMPPPGAWVLEGQRVLTGPRAVVAAKVLCLLAGVVALLALVVGALIWRIAGGALALGGGG